MIAILDYLIEQGFYLRQAFRMSNGENGDLPNMPRNAGLLSAVLIMASDHSNGGKLLQYLLGEKYINLWSNYFIKPFLESLAERQKHDLLADVLNISQ
jgi:hypothetical protein